MRGKSSERSARSPSPSGKPSRERPGSPGLIGFNTTSSLNVDTSKVKLNSKGGVLVTNAEIQNAFAFLDVDKSGKITLASLKKRLGVFFPDRSAKDYRFLMNGKRELAEHDLIELLMDNDITNFDPVAEAFKVCIV